MNRVSTPYSRAFQRVDPKASRDVFFDQEISRFLGFAEFCTNISRVTQTQDGVSTSRPVRKDNGYLFADNVRRTQFENSFTGTKYCIRCANGTDALQVALMALEVRPID